MFYNQSNRQNELRNYIGEKVWVHGTVITEPKISKSGHHYSVTVDVKEIEHGENRHQLNGRCIVYVKRYDNSAPKINQNIFFFTELEKPDYKEDSFDYEMYLKSKDVYATGFTYAVYPDNNSKYYYSPFEKLQAFGRNLNNHLQEKIEKAFANDHNTCALMKGILLGKKSDFSEDVSSDISKSGLSHIFAVSGLHLNIIFGTLCGFLGFIRFRKKLAIAITLPIILIFAAITEFSPSVCRAGIMIFIYMCAILTKQQYDSITALFISALVILLVNPYSIYSLSFILSFMSSLFIILFYKKISNCFKFITTKFNFLKGVISTTSLSLCSFIGTMPFIAYYFGSISFSGLISNIWIIPLCAPILVLGYILCFIIDFVPQFISNPLIYILSTCSHIILKTSELFAKIKMSYIEIPKFSPIFILLYFAIICIGYYFIKRYKTRHGII